jgi:hypothetical protein
MRVTDAQTGVCPSSNSCPGVGPHVQIGPLVGTQQVYFDSFDRISGDLNDGVYRKTVNISQYAKEGIWTISQVDISDGIGNHAFYNNSSELLVAVPTATGLTLANTATANSVNIERNWTITGNGNSVTFPTGTTVTKNDNGNFAFYQLTAQDYNITGLSHENLDGDVVGKIRLGIPGLNLSFS